jgi:alkylation response protein AidB-like acyl-CoA dehydrogenase
MSFNLTPTAAQRDLVKRTHEFAEEVIRPVAPEYDQRQEFPWHVVNAVVDQQLGHRGQAPFAKVRVRGPIMRLAMNVLRPPRK